MAGVENPWCSNCLCIIYRISLLVQFSFFSVLELESSVLCSLNLSREFLVAVLERHISSYKLQQQTCWLTKLHFDGTPALVSQCFSILKGKTSYDGCLYHRDQQRVHVKYGIHTPHSFRKMPPALHGH